MKKLLVIYMFCVVSGNSNAAIIDNDTYTTDTASGLDWLDVTTTLNMSYDYVTSQFIVGGDYEGWRYATGQQFNALISNATSSVVNTSELVFYDDGLVDDLVSYLGDTLGAYYEVTFNQTYAEYNNIDPLLSISYSHGILFDTTATSGWRRTAAVVDDDRTVENGGAGDRSTSSQNNWVEYKGGETFGSLLVRDTVSAVPIPAAAWLFGSGLLALAGAARRKKP